MKNLAILFIIATCVTSFTQAAPEPTFSGEVASVEYYTADISQSTGFSREAKQKIEMKLYDHWAVISVSWKSDAGSPEEAEYIIPRERIIRITVEEPKSKR